MIAYRKRFVNGWRWKPTLRRAKVLCFYDCVLSVVFGRALGSFWHGGKAALSGEQSKIVNDADMKPCRRLLLLVGCQLVLCTKTSCQH